MRGARRTSFLVDLAWRTVFRAAFPLARLCWRLRRRLGGSLGKLSGSGLHRGALVAVHVGPAVLLLRLSYRREWNFPGGGVRRNETPEEAARRELGEEVGLHPGTLQRVATVRGDWDGRPEEVTLFALHLPALPPLRLDNREIIAAELVPLDQWPDRPVTGPVAHYLRERRPAENGGTRS